MKVEILEESLKDTVEGRFMSLSEGDVVTVPDTVGEMWCAAGWAKDVDGTIETGERKPGAAAPLVVDNTVQN